MERVYNRNVLTVYRAVKAWMARTDRTIRRALAEEWPGGFAKAARNPYEAIDVVPWDKIDRDGRATIGPHQVRVYGQAMGRAAELAKIKTPWNLVNRRAVDWAKLHGATRVTAVTDETRAMLRGVVGRGIATGASVGDIAREIRGMPTIGLNAGQARALAGYRAGLEATEARIAAALAEAGGDAARAASLLGGRYGEKIVRAVQRGKFNVDRKVATEGARKANYRAEMIARTETAYAVSEGTLEGYKAAGVERVRFEAANDACEVCAGYDGNIYGRLEGEGLIPVHPNCFTSPMTKIMTVDGWKQIGKIVVGDLVLTHKGRFRKVTQLHRNSGVDVDVVRIRIKNTGDDSRIVVTAEHPLLVGCSWVPAKTLRPGDVLTWLVDACVESSQRLMKNHGGGYEFGQVPVLHVEHHKVKKTGLWNLSVEEDESYLAKGCVVHNCRCNWLPVVGAEAAAAAGPTAKEPVVPAVQQPTRVPPVVAEEPVIAPVPTAAEELVTVRPAGVAAEGERIPVKPKPVRVPNPKPPAPEPSPFSSGRIASEEPLGGGCNESLKVHIDGDGDGVYKPKKGEKTLRRSLRSGTYYKREVAASVLDKELGFEIVPETVLKEGRSGIGSVQLWVKDAKLGHTVEAVDILLVEREKLTVFDLLIGNMDRHGGNYLVTQGGRVAAIDNGLAFPVNERLFKYRENFRLAFHGARPDKISRGVRLKLESLRSRKRAVTRALRPYLSKVETDSLWARCDWILDKEEYFGDSCYNRVSGLKAFLARPIKLPGGGI